MTAFDFNPIRSLVETVLDFWLANVCMKECELIKGGHTFWFLAENQLCVLNIFESFFDSLDFGMLKKDLCIK